MVAYTGAGQSRESYCEYYASQIAKTMQLNAVHYDLENWKEITASKCELFTDVNTAYIPIGRIVRTGGIQKCLDYYDSRALEKLLEIRTRKLLAIPTRTKAVKHSKENVR